MSYLVYGCTVLNPYILRKIKSIIAVVLKQGSELELPWGVVIKYTCLNQDSEIFSQYIWSRTQT